jgi:hypothetical protein
MGRAAIAMAAVRRCTCDEPGKITDYTKLRPPTDATQWRPYPKARSGWLVAGLFNSALNAVLHSVLRHRLSHLPSAIDSAIDSVLSGRFAAVHSPAVISSVWSWKSACALSA